MMANVMIIEGDDHGKLVSLTFLSHEQIVNIEAALKVSFMDPTPIVLGNMRYEFELAADSFSKSTIVLKELIERFAEINQQSIVFDKPKNKFISKPLNNFKKR